MRILLLLLTLALSTLGPSSARVAAVIEEEYAKLREVVPDAPVLRITWLGGPGLYLHGGDAIGGSKPNILIDPNYHRNSSREDIRFVLAHELGHWLHWTYNAPEVTWMAENIPVVALVDRRYDPLQRFADDFALTLMPPGFDHWATLEKLGDRSRRRGK